MAWWIRSGLASLVVGGMLIAIGMVTGQRVVLITGIGMALAFAVPEKLRALRARRRALPEEN